MRIYLMSVSALVLFSSCSVNLPQAVSTLDVVSLTTTPTSISVPGATVVTVTATVQPEYFGTLCRDALVQFTPTTVNLSGTEAGKGEVPKPSSSPGTSANVSPEGSIQTPVSSGGIATAVFTVQGPIQSVTFNAQVLTPPVDGCKPGETASVTIQDIAAAPPLDIVSLITTPNSLASPELTMLTATATVGAEQGGTVCPDATVVFSVGAVAPSGVTNGVEPTMLTAPLSATDTATASFTVTGSVTAMTVTATLLSAGAACSFGSTTSQTVNLVTQTVPSPVDIVGVTATPNQLNQGSPSSVTVTATLLAEGLATLCTDALVEFQLSSVNPPYQASSIMPMTTTVPLNGPNTAAATFAVGAVESVTIAATLAQPGTACVAGSAGGPAAITLASQCGLMCTCMVGGNVTMECQGIPCSDGSSSICLGADDL